VRSTNSFATLVFVAILAVGVAVSLAMYGISARWESNWLILAAVNRAVVLRLGRFRALKGPGLFFIIPIINTIPYWIDTRVITSSFNADQRHRAGERRCGAILESCRFPESCAGRRRLSKRRSNVVP
jgi:regulator of protease activity HflC (stomatin/prohibitin superfamily)